MEPAGAADSAHMSHLVLTHFSLLDIYLLNMNSINTCTRGWLVWKIKMALSGRGRVEIPLPSFVFLSSTSSTQGTQYVLAPLMAIYLSCSLFYSTLTFLDCLQASQQCQCESGQTNNKDHTTKKLYQNKYLGQMANWELRNCASCFGCCFGGCES